MRRGKGLEVQARCLTLSRLEPLVQRPLLLETGDSACAKRRGHGKALVRNSGDDVRIRPVEDADRVVGMAHRPGHNAIVHQGLRRRPDGTVGGDEQQVADNVFEMLDAGRAWKRHVTPRDGE